MVPANQLFSPRWLLAALGATLLLGALAVACEEGATVTYVNNTDKVLFVDVNSRGGRSVDPHSQRTFSEFPFREDDPFVITARDETGNIVHYEETTVRELKEHDCRVLIEEATPGNG